MRFRDGLIQARGQIVFLVALVLSTIVIVWLERLDSEERIRLVAAQQMAEALRADERSDGLVRFARSADEALAAAEAGLTAGRPDTALALIAGAVAAERAGVLTRIEMRQAVERAIDALPDGPTADAALATAVVLAATAAPELEAEIRARFRLH